MLMNLSIDHYLYTTKEYIASGEATCPPPQMLVRPASVIIDVMSETTAYLQAITEVYPDFRIQKAQFYGQEGQFNDLLLLNDEFLFRFPKYPDGQARLTHEVRLLRCVQARLPLRIPAPIYFNVDRQNTGKVFMGYRMIPGAPLWCETLATITDEPTLQRLADQLAGFLKALHRLPVESVSDDLPVQDGPEEWAQLYADIRQHLFPWMRADARAWAGRHFEAYLSTPHLHHYPARLRHGDFGPSNVLYDPATRAISGIIDFGSAGVGDPALDIAAANCFGEAFLQRFYGAYPEITSLLERAQFYKGTFALQEALHGFRNNDREAFANGLAEYV
jgi:aminoglycoside 2''-phosphotransferase